MKRFRVAGHSMYPTLRPGQEIVAVDTRPPSPGDIVAFEHPDRDGFWLIKRLADSNGWVTSDNAADSDFDSNSLGVVDLSTAWTAVDRLDAQTFIEGCHLLADEDDDLNRIIQRWGMPEFWNRKPGFKTLVLLILEQQVSLESGAAMYKRLQNLVEDVSPEPLYRAGDEALRGIGVTRQKSRYLMGLAEACMEDSLDLDRLEQSPTNAARDTLMSLKGIGAWTADAYLLSASRRPDMWPVGDRALQVGAGEVVGMDRPADEEELTVLGEPWRPIRAVAARLIWHNYLCERGRVEPPDATL